MDTLINSLIDMEYECFNQTVNIGGKAECQSNYDKFYIMRNAQWQSLTKDIVQSVINDFVEAKNEGRNPISEKYGYMMATYAVDDYDKIKDVLPVVSFDKRNIVELIVSSYMKWYEELIDKYPKLMQNGRNLRTITDSYYNVSIETYLRSELLTYSMHTLSLWYEYTNSIAYNPVEIIYDYTAIGYGYRNSLDLENNI